MFFFLFLFLFSLRASEEQLFFFLLFLRYQSPCFSSFPLVNLPPAGASAPGAVPRGRPGARHEPSFKRELCRSEKRKREKPKSMARNECRLCFSLFLSRSGVRTLSPSSVQGKEARSRESTRPEERERDIRKELKKKRARSSLFCRREKRKKCMNPRRRRCFVHSPSATSTSTLPLPFSLSRSRTRAFCLSRPLTSWETLPCFPPNLFSCNYTR